MSRIYQDGNTTVMQHTRWDSFLAWWRHHVTHSCRAWCDYCYREACQ